MFGCIYVKKIQDSSKKNNKFKAKINCRSQKLQILTSSKINFTSKINSPLNHPNMLK